MFAPKEPLAIMNGTSVMTGIAVLAIDRARKIMDAYLLRKFPPPPAADPAAPVAGSAGVDRARDRD